ncbi:MAG: hypothetical protein ACLUOO_03085 [Coprococcus sp.]
MSNSRFLSELLKGTQLLEKDAWKEKNSLLQLRTEAVPATIFVDDNDYKIWGLHFFQSG